MSSRVSAFFDTTFDRGPMAPLAIAGIAFLMILLSSAFVELSGAARPDAPAATSASVP